MTIKIYTEGNYLYVEETEIGKVNTGLSKNAIISPSFSADSDRHFYTIHGVNGWDSTQHVELVNIIDETDTPFIEADFKLFYETELGKASAGGSAGTTLTATDIESALTYFIKTKTDEFTWNTGESQTFLFTSELVHEILTSVNGQILSNAQYTISQDRTSITIDRVLEDTDVVRIIYFKKYVEVEPETIAYMESISIPYNTTIAHNSKTGEQLWDYMDSLIKRAKGDGSWDTLSSWHPMLGATDVKHGYNVKDVTKFYMTFNGTWVIDEAGNKGNSSATTFGVADTNPTIGFTGDNAGWTIASSVQLNETAYIIGATDFSGTDERFGTIVLAGTVRNDYNDTRGNAFTNLGTFTSPMLVTAGMYNDTNIGILNGVEVINEAQTKPLLNFAVSNPYYGARNRNGGADNPTGSTLTSVAYHGGDPAILPLIHTLIQDWETFLGR